MADAPLPFGKKGPEPLMKTNPTERMTSDGKTVTTSSCGARTSSSSRGGRWEAEVLPGFLRPQFDALSVQTGTTTHSRPTSGKVNSRTFACFEA